MTERKPRRWYGIAAFIVVMVYLITIGYYPQYYWGLWGVGFNELVLLGLALLGWAVSRRPFHEVFPFHKPTGREFGGSLLVWSGAYLITLGLSVVMLYLFPEMAEVNESLNRIVTSEPFPVRLLIIGIAPAVCEEAVHRGVVLSGFDRLRSVWPRIIIMGLLFGLFHTDIYRFIPTMVLGMAITYAMIKTENLWMPMLLHFLNNGISVLATAAETEVDIDSANAVLEQLDSKLSLQLMVIYAGIGTILLMFGVRKLCKIKERES